MSDGVTLEWLGCTTFRLRARDTVLFFDSFVDRIAAAPQVGVRSSEIDRADAVFISHTHVDHMLGADVIAANTGCIVVGSYETVRALSAAGVPAAQLVPVAGGESIRISDDVRVRVFPGLHSCLFATLPADSGQECLGDLGVEHRERVRRVDTLLGAAREFMTDEMRAWLSDPAAALSAQDGGQMVYLVETTDGSVLHSASAGCWTGMLGAMRADVVLLATAGRANLDAEPFQGSMAGFLLTQVEALQPRRVVLCHHDAWLPPLINAVDLGEAQATLRTHASAAELVSMSYSEPLPVLRRGALN